MSSPEYTPIACSVYDLLEATAVKNAVVRIEMQSGDTMRTREVRVIDLFSKDKVEFMKAIDTATQEEFTLRLDEIHIITDIASNKTYSSRSC